MCLKIGDNQVIVQSPISTIPQYPTWIVDRYYFVQLCNSHGIEAIDYGINAVLYSKVRYTDLKHTDLLVQDLMPHLPKNSADWSRYCYYQAQSAFVTCVKRYGINAMAVVLDVRSELDNPNGHAYCIIGYGGTTGLEDLLLFEPNEGYEWSGIVPWGEHNYIPERVFI